MGGRTHAGGAARRYRRLARAVGTTRLHGRRACAAGTARRYGETGACWGQHGFTVDGRLGGRWAIGRFPKCTPFAWNWISITKASSTSWRNNDLVIISSDPFVSAQDSSRSFHAGGW